MRPTNCGSVCRPCVLTILSTRKLTLIGRAIGVLPIAEIQYRRTNQIRALNQKLHQDKRINLSLVPIADGLTLAMKLP